jgi:hypothetical protein
MKRNRDVESSHVSSGFCRLEGYSELSEFVGSDAQLSIYRRYDRVGARNLLYLEAEIQLLEFRLRRLDEADLSNLQHAEDRATIDDRERCWEIFLEHGRSNEMPFAKAKLNLIYELRGLMKDYGGFRTPRRQRKLSLTNV